MFLKLGVYRGEGPRSFGTGACTSLQTRPASHGLSC